MDKDKLLAIAAIALSNGQDIAGENEMDFAIRMGLETEYFSGASWYEIFWYYYQPPNTASTGIAIGSDKPALAASKNQPVSPVGSPAIR